MSPASSSRHRAQPLAKLQVAGSTQKREVVRLFPCLSRLQKVGVESQNGFMLRRGCTDAIFSLKVALQKRKEHMQDSWVLLIHRPGKGI